MNAAGQVKSYLPKARFILRHNRRRVAFVFLNLIFQEDWMRRFTWVMVCSSIAGDLFGYRR
jgi:hypothetical protein